MKKWTFLVFLSVFSNVVLAEEGNQLKMDDYYYSQLKLSIGDIRAKEELNKAIMEHNQAKLEHREILMRYKETTYRNQQVMSVLIFVIVATLVVGGAWLAYRQFLLDAENQQNSKAKGETLKSAIRISRDGVELSSSVIGLMMLFMSFFFFYLYVSEVYTIKHNELKPLKLVEQTNDIQK